MPTNLGLAPRVAAVLERLHAASDSQTGLISDYYAKRSEIGDVEVLGEEFRAGLQAEDHEPSEQQRHR